MSKTKKFAYFGLPARSKFLGVVWDQGGSLRLMEESKASVARNWPRLPAAASDLWLRFIATIEYVSLC